MSKGINIFNVPTETRLNSKHYITVILILTFPIENLMGNCVGKQLHKKNVFGIKFAGSIYVKL